MIEIELYRSRIGAFNLLTIRIQKLFYNVLNRIWKTTFSQSLAASIAKLSPSYWITLILIVGVFAFSCYLILKVHCGEETARVQCSHGKYNCQQDEWFILKNMFNSTLTLTISRYQSMKHFAIARQGLQYRCLSKLMESNFKAKYLYGNIDRGLKNIHINVRSLYNKITELKTFMLKEKPHILGVSEAELLKDFHSEAKLKIPGYTTLFPKSWDRDGRARVIVYVKKCLQYTQLHSLESSEVQSIWLAAGFKNCKQVFFSHIYREHTNTLGSSLASQRAVLDLMLKQWEDAASYKTNDGSNEIHISGDMNLDCLGGRWLENDYPLVSLSRMVRDICFANNFSQLVDKVTRVQFNSVRNTTQMSCIDHLYTNAKHRISPVKILAWGASDHDAVSFIRYSKEPKPPSRTIRKRSFKNFDSGKYLHDMASVSFNDVYSSLDVDEAAVKLTENIVSVLNLHAPWIIFQQRKNYAPWVTESTVKMMKERDKLKTEAKELARLEGNNTSSVQRDKWCKFKKIRNQINNKIKYEEIQYKKGKLSECQNSSSQVWGLAKKFMDWSTAGPPTQLEIVTDSGINLVTKAAEIAQEMNLFFVDKVNKLTESLKDVPLNLSGCSKIVNGKKLSMSLKHVTVRRVRQLLLSLKNKTSASVDQLDNYSVRLAADFIAEPLHHVICLSIMQQKFPSCWKYTKIVPLHKKKSVLKKENYRPVAILSPLSKILEKVVYEQMYGYFSRNDLFTPSLHGYRENRSTLTAMLTMYDKWVLAASKGQLTGVVLADLSAAFDLVDPDLLMKKLEIYGFEDDMIAWLRSYLTDRYQAVWIDHAYSNFIEHSLGVPQGSNLGPLLFLIFFNDLPTFMAEDIECFADDSTLSATKENLSDVEKSLSEDCNKFSQWMSENKFKLNVEKTNFLRVGTAMKLQRTRKLTVMMDGMVLRESESNSESLLGVIIQNDLKWSSQINALCTKLKSRLAGLSKLRMIMSKRSKRMIIEGVFQSVLSYCLPLFGGCAVSELNLLQTLQNKAARIILNLPSRSNRSQMYDSLGWLTVRQLVAYYSLLTIFRIRCSKQPEYLAYSLLRENHNGHIIVKNNNLQLYRSSFMFRGPILWNKMPLVIRKETKLNSFKTSLSSWIQSNIPRFED